MGAFTAAIEKESSVLMLHTKASTVRNVGECLTHSHDGVQLGIDLGIDRKSTVDPWLESHLVSSNDTLRWTAWCGAKTRLNFSRQESWNELRSVGFSF